MSEKRYNVVEVLSKVSGMPIETANALFEEVKENHVRLDSCSGPHEFEEVNMGGSGGFARDMRCKRCGGVLNRVHAIWYERGVKHGREAAT